MPAIPLRRRRLTVGVIVVFVIWNITTYLFITLKQPEKDEADEKKREFSRQVLDLQQRLKLQSIEQKNILKNLEDARNELMDIANNNVPSSTTHDSRSLVLRRKQDIPIVVVVMACNRPTVSRNLDQLLRFRPSAELFPIVVSQDCGHAQTADVIRSYGDKVLHLLHPDLSDIELPKKDQRFKGYYMIARHYKWALNQVFHKLNYSAAIIVEDDLNVSPDFFEYFAATFPLLQMDSSLWCVSAWNDNGKAGMVASSQPELLYRTDFFPGLGWLLQKQTWLELEPKWPETFWDDWMRHPNQRGDRACIRPEIPRTSTFGKIGVSKGQYFEKHLKFVEHNTKFVPFTAMDLSYLLKDNYDEAFVKTVYSTPLVPMHRLTSAEGISMDASVAVRVEYDSKESFKTLAKQIGIMDDLKAGVPRSGYRGVVSSMFRGRRIYLSPPKGWTAYDPTWN